VERTAEVVQEMLAAHPGRAIETLYVTGGGSELPAVTRVLKETFGRAVKRSAYMRSATAIGLAISADENAGYVLRDRFARHFGVWREADSGREATFDVLFPCGLELPPRGAPALRVTRGYRAVHNIGHFRYAEATRLRVDGQPSGDLTIWDDILFPSDPALRAATDLTLVDVSRRHGADWDVEEEYTCDASGIAKIAIANRSAGYRREYTWAAGQRPLRALRTGWGAGSRNGLERCDPHRGIVTVNVLPIPGVLARSTAPRCDSAIHLTIASPSPKPPSCRERALSAR
jgi:molecular chaperone DnaK (HSP70)